MPGGAPATRRIATSGAVVGPGSGVGQRTPARSPRAHWPGSRLVFIKFDPAGHLQWTRAPEPLRGYGRLRSVTSLANGDLLVTTSNGGGTDAVLRVRPRG